MKLWFLLLLLVFINIINHSFANNIENELDLDLDLEDGVSLPGYRQEIAQQLRNFAQANYCSVDSVTKWECPLCKQGV